MGRMEEALIKLRAYRGPSDIIVCRIPYDILDTNRDSGGESRMFKQLSEIWHQHYVKCDQCLLELRGETLMDVCTQLSRKM